MSKTRGWAYQIRPVTDGERAQQRLWADRYPGYPATIHCSARGCAAEATHVTSYRYITGAGGRCSTNRRNVCGEHAERFRAKHPESVR